MSIIEIMPPGMGQANRYYWLLMRKLRADFGGKCQFCDSDEYLEFAHKIGLRRSGNNRGRNDRVREIHVHPERFNLLCRSCHNTYDRQNPPTKAELAAQAEEAPF